jgi:hypothetical protein
MVHLILLEKWFRFATQENQRIGPPRQERAPGNRLRSYDADLLLHSKRRRTDPPCSACRATDSPVGSLAGKNLFKESMSQLPGVFSVYKARRSDLRKKGE